MDNKEITWSTTTKINPLFVSLLKKEILRAKIACEMKMYQDNLKWQEYSNNITINNIKIGYSQN